MTGSQNDSWTKWLPVHIVTQEQNDYLLTKWRVDKINSFQNDCLTTWLVGEMTNLQNDLAPKLHLRRFIFYISTFLEVQWQLS